jgi:hypothetical protein
VPIEPRSVSAGRFAGRPGVIINKAFSFLEVQCIAQDDIEHGSHFVDSPLCARKWTNPNFAMALDRAFLFLSR